MAPPNGRHVSAWANMRLRWRRVNPFIRAGMVAAAPVVGFGAYVGVSMCVYSLHSPVVDHMFQETEVDADPTFAEHFFVLEDWSRVRKTLQLGDVVLLMGTGDMSWKITNSQFALSGMRPAALRYSHVGVVTKPYNPKTKEGPWCMEVVDNGDLRIPDIGGVVRRRCCMVVDVDKRINGTVVEVRTVIGPDGGETVEMISRPAYKRLGVRRLQGFTWTEPRKKALQAFVDGNVGRPMDSSPLIMLTALSTPLYGATGHRYLSSMGTCSEIIADMFEYVGVSKRIGETPVCSFEWESLKARFPKPVLSTEETCPRFVKSPVVGSPMHMLDPAIVPPNPLHAHSSVRIVPAHFAEGLDKDLNFSEGVCFGPEVHMPIKGAQGRY